MAKIRPSSADSAPVWIGCVEMRSVAGSPTLGLDWSLPIYTMPDGATSALSFSKAVPAFWGSYKVTAYWAPATGAGGNIDFSVDFAQLDVAQSVNDGTTTSVVGVAGTNTNTVVTTDLVTGAVGGQALMWMKITRNGASGTDTATADLRLIGVMLTRTS